MPIRHLSIRSLLPDTDHFMTYEGSTTHPGCWETTVWIILNKPIYITRAEVGSSLFLSSSLSSRPPLLLLDMSPRLTEDLSSTVCLCYYFICGPFVSKALYPRIFRPFWDEWRRMINNLHNWVPKAEPLCWLLPISSCCDKNVLAPLILMLIRPEVPYYTMVGHPI